MPTPDPKVQSLIHDLPDEKGPLAFLERIQQEHPQAYRLLMRERGLLSDALALAAWSPLLATTLEQNPTYLSWLQRERSNTRVRTSEELKESLARFALTNSSLTPQAVLTRFRRRELLRTYLHDIRGTHTLVDTTEELSNVADAVLDYALNLARQELDNRYGLPRRADERGRMATADFTIVALGKLGSCELNYASDIDLMFIYSDEGTTSGLGERGEVTNREYFVKLAETVARLVGQPSGEGVAYRVDLRLRPHGRDGALACSLAEAVRYYRDKAQAWERQTLIRSRAAAGSTSLFLRFSDSVRATVFRADVSVKEALASVRLAKQKIDRHRESDTGGFNVKLHRGGIREIEFIAQALQLAHGGRDEWLRAAHTLISLGRLADRNLIFEHERSELSDAYFFLRKVEHRLQMEQGLQTHTIPLANEARSLLAGRMNFSGEHALPEFDEALAGHRANVHRVFGRVFHERAESDETGPIELEMAEAGLARIRPLDSESAIAFAAANAFLPHISPGEAPHTVASLAKLLQQAAQNSLNANRAMNFAARIGASLDKATEPIQISESKLAPLIQLCAVSEFFGEILAGNPSLVNSLEAQTAGYLRRDFRGLLRAAIDAEQNLAGELSALRRLWFRLLLEIGQRDAAGEMAELELNRVQTDLAIASINVAYLIARRELVRRFGKLIGGPRIAVLGLGRLGTGGVDYGSDLDVVIIYDTLAPSPIRSMAREEAYARLAELMIGALSSVTREGYLYRVDLRLRPNGQSGPLVTSSEGFVDYAKTGAHIWEWLAYVKLRAVAGNLELGRMIETHARHAIHENARMVSPEELKSETRRVRDRLEAEKGKRLTRGELDIKYAAGGMLDVYFLTRYLQLLDDVPDEGEDRSTRSTLDRLEGSGSLGPEDYATLDHGYALLRSIDHQLRLMIGKSARLPAADHAVTHDSAITLGFDSAEDLRETVVTRMKAIRATYQRVMD